VMSILDRMKRLERESKHWPEWKLQDLEDRRLVEDTSGPTVVDVEKKTLDNKAFRRVLHTAKRSQLVVMSLLPGEDIGMETHPHTDQFLRIEKGHGKAILNGRTYRLVPGSAVLVTAGTRHNVVNTSRTEPLRLYTVYSPAKHPPGTVELRKPTHEELVALVDDLVGL